MIRAITGFHRGMEGDWVAELSCHRRQHVRHRPPFQQREWVLDPSGREARIGTDIECPLSDRAEMPLDLVVFETLGPWDQSEVPEALGRIHRAPPGRWGRLVLLDGTIDHQFRPDEIPPGEVLTLSALDGLAIPPGVPHRVIATCSARLQLELLGVAT